MGGHLAGEVASRIAVETLDDMLSGKQPDPSLFRGAVRLANSRIRYDSDARIEHTGMGTTLTCLWVDEYSVLIAQVGDSRAYLLRGGDFFRCTHDHSLVEELVSKGVITAEQARTHPERNVITRALGTSDNVLVDLFEWDRKKGDVWLVCSDGLTDMLDDSRIKQFLLAEDADDAADMLLTSALVSGGTDNISFIILVDGDGEKL
jgi:protein phosphatase